MTFKIVTLLMSFNTIYDMDNIELLEKIQQQIGRVSKPKDAHIQEEQIFRSIRQQLEQNGTPPKNEDE